MCANNAIFSCLKAVLRVCVLYLSSGLLVDWQSIGCFEVFSGKDGFFQYYQGSRIWIFLS